MSNDIEWTKDEDGIIKPIVYDEEGRKVSPVWAPQPGSQQAFLSCPVFEVLLHGSRGGGKTDALLFDFAQDVGMWGSDWRGVIFRQTHPQLQDLIAKSKKWFTQIFPDAKYNESKSKWIWPTGEELLLRHMSKPSDYYNMHGSSFPFIGWEELTTWSDLQCYLLMFSCSRSAREGMPRKVRATTNPYGPSHNQIKRRFRLPGVANKVMGPLILDDGPPRTSVQSYLQENKILLSADPDYIERLRSAARNESERAAWLHGSWDITSGGMFDDLWSSEHHVVEGFPLEMARKHGWRFDRSFDWGSSHPFSVGWWVESNGEPITHNGKIYGHVPGDLYRIREWYGWNGRRNEGLKMLAEDIAIGIREMQIKWEIDDIVRPGPADSSIFDLENGRSVAVDMRKQGVRWEKADKRPGSRKQGWEQIRRMLSGSLPVEGQPRENPGIFFFRECDQALELIPPTPRSTRDLDDVDTDSEDHCCDEIRYRVRRKPSEVQQRAF